MKSTVVKAKVYPMNKSRVRPTASKMKTVPKTLGTKMKMMPKSKGMKMTVTRRMK